jgi:hypothetical protein
MAEAPAPLFPAPLITPAGLRASLWRTSAHVNYGRLGSLLVKDCLTFPGLSYSDTWDRGARTNTRTFFVAGDQRSFSSAPEAAKAWNDQRRAAAAPVEELAPS